MQRSTKESAVVSIRLLMPGAISTAMAKNSGAGVVFQTALREADDATSQFFELANTDTVRYETRTGTVIDIRQDRNNNTHTGGIIWETAFLLAMYLENHVLNTSKAKRTAQPLSVLEVGAGCGLLGLVIAHGGHQVVLTEHPDALGNLQRNVVANRGTLPTKASATAAQLRWGVREDIDAVTSLGTGTFDMIVGTDVVYQAELVEPLLQTISAFSSSKSVVWLCLQERCAAAHKRLMELLPVFFSSVREFLPSELPPGLEFAEELECKIYRLADIRTNCAET
jgi:predicted nicotinamide N-methyase